ncbi:hypothetical protein C1645_830524 [Glomus cerebriforme]|uniref:Uncharacterized protein n=1 Tax=Glomus cerebriforme TaxID=658196 RepID=A0A397SNS8_9GLOM|nr:hypothetical protein C1645_830524 [Glomus cerebriforme]
MSLKKIRALFNIKNTNISASSFTKNDVKALRVRFQPASAENDIVPDVEVTSFPKEYIFSHINHQKLRSPDFNVSNLEGIYNGKVLTFISHLQKVVNSQETIGTEDSNTDSLILDMCHKIGLNWWPLNLKLFFDKSNEYDDFKQVHPEIVIARDDTTVLAVETDKQLKNIGPMTDFGETQITAELLFCAYENNHSIPFADQTIFIMRTISTYVTFYKAVIPGAYWKELNDGLPQEQSIVIQRWPRENNIKSGLDLAEPDGRQAVITALIKIRQSLL